MFSTQIIIEGRFFSLSQILLICPGPNNIILQLRKIVIFEFINLFINVFIYLLLCYTNTNIF